MIPKDRTDKGLWWSRAWKLVEGCSKVSPGCDNCWSEEETRMRSHHPNEKIFERAKCVLEYHGGDTPDSFCGHILCREDNLELPLRTKKPTVFALWNDLYHEDVPDSFRDRAYAVMALCSQHTFLILTKRAERMAEYFTDKETSFRIALQIDVVSVREEAALVKRQIRPIDGYPNYFVSNDGIIYSSHGSSTCLHCGNPVDGYAKKKYCSVKCRKNAGYRSRTGRGQKHEPTLTPMKPMVSGRDGDNHLRVMLYLEDGTTRRELVHRIVLTTFSRRPVDDEQCCHRDGNPENNHIANLRWGTQVDNWEDRKRHGRGQAWAVMTPSEVDELRASNASVHDLALLYGISETQARNIKAGKQWAVDAAIHVPSGNCFHGVTAENQQTANERIPHLLRVPGKRFLSIEPMLGPMDLGQHIDAEDDLHCDWCGGFTGDGGHDCYEPEMGIHAVLLGGESGKNARPLDREWVRSVRDQCAEADIPFTFKQWGESAPNWLNDDDGKEIPGTVWTDRMGKKRAGRTLDGIIHNNLPWDQQGESK